MNILYFIPRYDASLMGNRIHTEVIAEWRAQGIQTDVITLTTGIRRMVTEIQEGVAVHRLPVGANRALKLANRALDALLHYPYLAGALLHYRRFLGRRRYDLLHVETSFPLGLVVALTPRAIQPPLALTLPGADIMAEPDYDYGYGRFASVRALLPWIFRRADVIRADSPQIKTLAVRLGAPPERVVAIPYNITADSFPAPGADLAQLRARARAQIVAQHGLDPTRPLIVSLNRLHPFKGFNYLVEAVPAMHQSGLNPQVVIVGPNRSTPRFGDYGAYLRRRAEELGVADALIFAGGVEHAVAQAYLAAADVVVVASVAESFSRVVIEAAAVGTPVVVTRTTGASDYVSQICGLVVEPRSAATVAEAVSRLLSDRPLWERFSAAAPHLAAEFSSNAIAARLLDLYHERLPAAFDK